MSVPKENNSIGIIIYLLGYRNRKSCLNWNTAANTNNFKKEKLVSPNNQ